MLNDKFWNKYFHVYDVLNELYPYQKLLDTFVDKANLNKGALVLDAGAGTGNLAQKLRVFGAEIHTIDISDVGTRMILEKIPEANTCVGSLCETLPYNDNFFDIIVSNNVIYTLPEKDRPSVARELYRVLKPGGKIIVSNIAPRFSPITIYLHHVKEEFTKSGILNTFIKVLRFIPATVKMFYYNILIDKENDGGGYAFLDESMQKSFLEDAGFKNVSDGVRIYADQAVLHTARK